MIGDNRAANPPPGADEPGAAHPRRTRTGRAPSWLAAPGVRRYAAAQTGLPPPLRLAIAAATPLTGGAVAASVVQYRLRVSTSEKGQPERTLKVVAKVGTAAEIAVMRWLARQPAGLAVPALLAAGGTRRAGVAPWFVTPFVAGPPLAWSAPVPDAVLTTLGQVHAAGERSPRLPAIPTFDPGFLGALLTNALTALATSHRFRRAEPDHVARRRQLAALGGSSALAAATADLPRTVTHGDMHPGNVLLPPCGGAVIIDWGNARLAPGPLDLANMVALDSPAWTIYRHAYLAAGGEVPLAALRRGYHWARVATALMYLPWAVAHLDSSGTLIEQALTSEQALRTGG